MKSVTRWLLIWLFTWGLLTELMAWLYTLLPWQITTPFFVQSFSQAVCFTALWAWGYHKQARDHAEGLPPLKPVTPTAFSQDPLRILIIWAGLSAAVASLSLLRACFPGGPSAWVIVFHTLACPTITLLCAAVMDALIRPLFRAPENSSGKLDRRLQD